MDLPLKTDVWFDLGKRAPFWRMVLCRGHDDFRVASF